MAQTNTTVPLKYATTASFLNITKDAVVPMKVGYKLTGGIAGLNLSVVADTNSLPLDEARHLQGLVRNSNFFDIPSKSPPAPSARDLLNHTITIQLGEEKSHTIQTNDITMPPELRPLVEYLREKLAIK